jgi:hypothetical protein
MRSGIVVGAGAGFVGGIAAAAALSIVAIKGRQGEITRAIALVSQTQLAVATAIGALFGVLYTALGLRRESAAYWATMYGIAWWIVGWFAVMLPQRRYAPWEQRSSVVPARRGRLARLPGLRGGARRRVHPVRSHGEQTPAQ